jgi:hypothetical protein
MTNGCGQGLILAVEIYPQLFIFLSGIRIYYVQAYSN